MAPGEPRRLIVNADDFGASASINAAVIHAHEQGVLTSASLMVNGPAFEEAVALAESHPRLGVGLHLTLCCGTSTLDPGEIPDLVDRNRHFSNSPVGAGLRYFFSREARRQLALEIEAQFAKFASTGLAMDHLNGHLHFHLHPGVFPLLREQIRRWKVRAVRLTRDPPSIDLPLGRGRWFYRLSHALIFPALAARARAFLAFEKVAHSNYVFGLLEHGRISERYITGLIPRLPHGASELYAHPSLGEFKHELQALVSPAVRQIIQAQNIQLIRYRDLWLS